MRAARVRASSVVQPDWSSPSSRCEPSGSPAARAAMLSAKRTSVLPLCSGPSFRCFAKDHRATWAKACDSVRSVMSIKSSRAQTALSFDRANSPPISRHLDTSLVRMHRILSVPSTGSISRPTSIPTAPTGGVALARAFPTVPLTSSSPRSSILTGPAPPASPALATLSSSSPLPPAAMTATRGPPRGGPDLGVRKSPRRNSGTAMLGPAPSVNRSKCSDPKLEL